MTLRQHESSDLHLDFCVFFSKKYFGRKFISKVQHRNSMNEKLQNLKSTQKHDSRVDLQNLNHRNARTRVDLRFNRFIFLNLL